MSDNQENVPEDPGVRIAHLLISILAGAQILQHDVLDVVDVDRNEIVEIADNIEKYVHEIGIPVAGGQKPTLSFED